MKPALTNTKGSHSSSLSAEDGSSKALSGGGGLPEYSRAEDVPEDDSTPVKAVEPLVYVNRNGRESARCHTVGMRRLEPLQSAPPRLGQQQGDAAVTAAARSSRAVHEEAEAEAEAGAWSWEDSQALIARVFGR